MIIVRHIKKTCKQFLHQKVVSHVEDNQRNIWWDPTGRFLGPGWVRNGPIALLKMLREREIANRTKSQRYTKNDISLH